MFNKIKKGLRTIWDKVFRNSETIFLSFVQGVIGLGAFFWESPEVKSAIQTLATPEHFAMAMVGLGVVTFFARINRATDI